MTVAPVLTDDSSIEIPAAFASRLGSIDRIRECNKTNGGPCSTERAQQIQRETKRVLRLVTQLSALPKEQVGAYVDAAATSTDWDEARIVATVYLTLVKRHTASEVAQILNIKTRNPVVGKIHRMGLSEEQNEDTGMTATQRARAQEKSFEARMRRDPAVEAAAAAAMAKLDPVTDQMMLAERALRLQASGEKATLHQQRFTRVNHGFKPAGPLHRVDGNAFGIAALPDAGIVAMYFHDAHDRTDGWRIFAQTRTAPNADEYYGNSINLSVRTLRDIDGGDVYLITGTTQGLMDDDSKIIPDSDMPDPEVLEGALRGIGLSGMDALANEWPVAPTAIGPKGFVFGGTIDIDEIPVGMAVDDNNAIARIKARPYGGQQNLRDIVSGMRRPGTAPRAGAFSQLAKQHACPLATPDRVDPQADIKGLDQLFV